MPGDTDTDSPLRDTDPVLWAALRGADFFEAIPVGAGDNKMTAAEMWSRGRSMAKLIRREYPDPNGKIAIPVLIDKHDAKTLLAITNSQITRLVKKGLIPHLVLPEKIVVFDREELVEWMNARRVSVDGDHQNVESANQNADQQLS